MSDNLDTSDRLIDNNSRFQSLHATLPKGRGEFGITVGVTQTHDGKAPIGVSMDVTRKLSPEQARWLGEALLKAFSFAKEIDDPIIAWRMDVDDHPET